jgi:hypothetical protein
MGHIMKKRYFVTIAVCFFTFFTSLSNQIREQRNIEMQGRYEARDIKSSTQVKKSLIEQGYSEISIEGFFDGKYKAIATTQDGQRVILFLDPETIDEVKQ